MYFQGSISNYGRDEHYKRSPDCPFFTLGKQNSSARKAKTKKDRTSKSSRLSTQSTFTAASEAPSLADLPLDEDDSVLTVGTSAPATPAEKKMEKKKRTTTAKARKTKAKKSEAVEVPPAVEVEDNDVEDKEVPAPKATRGRKRKSEQIQDSTTDVVEAEAPAPKRRATRTRGSAAVEDITLPSAEQNVPQTNTDEPSSSTGRSRAKSVAKTARKPSTRVASRKIQAPPPPTDEELDAALQADLERHASDDEKMPVIVPSKKATKSGKVAKADHAMFDPEPMDIDEVAIEAELEAMEAESKPLPKPKAARGRPRKASAKQQAATKKPVEDETEAREAADELASQAVDELASDQIATELEVSVLQPSPPALKPKKQRAASRKVSKPVPARGTRPSVLSVHDNSIIQTDDLQSGMVDQKKDDHDEQNDDFGNDTNLSMASQSTVVRTSTSTHRDSTVKRKRGRPSKQEVASRNIEEIVQTSFSSTPNNDIDELVDPPVSMEEASPDEISRTEERFYTPAPEFYQEEENSVPEVIRPQPARQVGRPPKAAREPMAIISTPLPPKDENRSPSPQSSDVENQPPSSKPSTAKKSATPKPISTRVPLAPTTPAMSPSKHNVISCLQSANPWTAVDLDTIFLRTPRDENAMAKGLFDDALAKVKNSELTSPEKKMSVEEWILYNAEVAEEKLRNECERMVGLFEREGTRAMAALEGVECTE